MAENIDDISMEWKEEDGTVTTKEVDKKILTRGSWTTIMFLYQDMDRNSGEYGPQKVSIRRYQKRNGAFRQQSKFNISSAKQAHQIIEGLHDWFPPAEESDTK